MNPNSRDNVNVEATVTCTAYDRNGNIVDQDKYYGRHEPSTRLLDFMLNCEAMFGKQGTKIIRYTCEIAYVLVALIYLSSAVVSAKEYDYASPRIPSASADVYSIRSLRSTDNRRLVPRPRPLAATNAFKRSYEPIRWYAIKWPPVETETSRLIRIAYERVAKLEQPILFEWRVRGFYVAAGAVGAGLIVFALAFRKFRYYK